MKVCLLGYTVYAIFASLRWGFQGLAFGIRIKWDKGVVVCFLSVARVAKCEKSKGVCAMIRTNLTGSDPLFNIEKSLEGDGMQTAAVPDD